VLLDGRVEPLGGLNVRAGSACATENGGQVGAFGRSLEATTAQAGAEMDIKSLEELQQPDHGVGVLHAVLAG
jgi:hypothetical protein